MAKKKLLIDATGNSRWIGGLYYKKNIIFSLLQNEWIKNNYQIMVVTENENRKLFEMFSNDIPIKYIKYKYQKERFLKIYLKMLISQCDYVFPCINASFCEKFRFIGINWIPDFQHYHLPENFSEEEQEKRRKGHLDIASSVFPLVLSSTDCKNDFVIYCSNEKENVYVVPFVSYIEDEIRKLKVEREVKILNKYGLNSQKYVIVANQFWKHKNHITVIKAIKHLYNQLNKNNKMIYVFTGKLQDNKAPEYIEELKQYFDDDIIKRCCKILGFISRDEQIALMKNAEYIIQPSLFEGWGTVVEDAKVLDKTIILSDIPVHREQMNNKCILFDPYNSKELAALIAKENEKEHIDNVESGIADMYIRAKEYSKGFEQLLKDVENRGNL